MPREGSKFDIGRWVRNTAMERFIRRENIKRYRKLLRDAKDEAERRLIQKLLTEAEQKGSAEKTPSPSIVPVRHVPPQPASAVLSDLQKRPKSKV
jgi:hypothetical protein